MAASPEPSAFPVRRPDAQIVRDLLKLQKAAQKISSTLDIDVLMDKIVHEVAATFGCLEASVWLADHGRGEMVLAGVRGCTTHKKGHRFKIGEEGMVGWVAAHGRTRYAPDVTLDEFYIRCEHDTRSEIVIPLRARGEMIGAFVAGHPELDGFSGWHRQLLEGLADQIAIAVDNASRFRHEQSVNEAILREAAEARVVQEALLPKASPFAPGFSVQGCSLPAGAVGGDWYDYIPLSEGKWGIVLADVSGKGMAAALLMSATRAALRSMADTCFGPGGVLQKLNRQLVSDIPAGRFITMIFGIFDPAARKLTFANAGHPWPVFASANGSGTQALPTERGLPLGINESFYSEVDVELTPGSRLLFYSDGISEAENPAGDEYGQERIFAQLDREDVCADTLLEDIKRFAGGRAQHDDATVILIRAE
ncbi:MAG: SpoIIE family protein phosphatase [Acidobacteriota bacterium]|nr:SpoIIE family protein phosphatase [Acidobacteriota bacterium]